MKPYVFGVSFHNAGRLWNQKHEMHEYLSGSSNFWFTFTTLPDNILKDIINDFNKTD